MKFYKDEKVKKAVEDSKSFAGTFPKQASLEAAAPDAKLEDFAGQLLKQYQSEEVAGVELHSINFTVILKAD